MAWISQAGSIVTGAQIVDESISLSDLDATAKPTYYVKEALTVVPKPAFHIDTDNQDGALPFGVAGNTKLYLAQLIVTTPITVSKVSLRAVTANVAGTFKLALYSEDGTVKLFEKTTASVSGGGTVTTTLDSAVFLAVGVYYFAILAVGTANVDFGSWYLTSQAVGALLSDGVSSEPVIVGYATVTADTIPSTISPAALTAQNPFPVIRLDA